MREELSQIRRAGRMRLAEILEQAWEQPAGEWSARLHSHRPVAPMEPSMLKAFGAGLKQRELGIEDTRRCLDALAQHRVLQTATHVTASEGPTFLAVHLVATAGLPADRPYLVGAYSGVPFANPAWSACLNYSNRHGLDSLVDTGASAYRELERNERQRALDSQERRISLIPGSLRDARLYRCLLPEHTGELLAQLRPGLRRVLPAAKGGTFSAWAIRASEALSARLLGRKAPVVYLDLNEVITTYLLAVLPESSHPMHRLLFDASVRERVLAEPGLSMPWFNLSSPGAKRERMLSLHVRQGKLEGPAVTIDLDPPTILDALDRGTLGPGLVPTFCALAFCNHFLCLGSFEQVEYLHRLRAGLAAAGWPEPGMASRVPTDGLTTGRFMGEDASPFYPLDAVLGTRFVAPSPATTVGELIRPLLSRLLQTRQAAGSTVVAT